MNETQLAADFDLINSLKLETDALLSETRSLWTQKKEVPFRAGAVHKQAPKKKKTSSKTDKALGGKKKGLQRSKSFNSTSSAAFTLYQDSSTNENFDDDGYEMVEEVDVGPRKAGKRRASRKQRPALGELINAVNQGSGDFHEVQRATTSHDGGGRARAQVKATSRAHTQGAHATNKTNVPPLAPLKGVLKRTLSAGDVSKPVGGRLTLEVYDDASPDASPRHEETIHKAVDVHKIQAEKPFSRMPFVHESQRVALGADTYVPDDGRLSTEGIEKEYQRLAELEDAAREGRRRMVGREQWWSKNLVGNDAALHIQRVARGVVGRRRAWLKMQLDGPPDAAQETEGEGGDWVEIKDREKGEAWFYNKRSGISQWNRPFELLDSVAKIEAANSDSVSMSPRDAGKRSVSFGQNVTTKLIDPTDLDELIAADVTAGGGGDRVDPAVEQEAQKEIEHVLGTKNILKADCFTYPDGVFKPTIKRTVQDALLETRFDSVSHVLLDKGWIDTHKEGPYEHPGKPQRKRVPKLPGKDLTRQPMSAVSKLNMKHDASIRVEKKKKVVEVQQQDMTFGKIMHPGYADALKSLTEGDVKRAKKKDAEGNELDSDSDDDRSEVSEIKRDESICFGCWSQGKGKHCGLHADPDTKVRKSRTMLLCRNWDLNVMRRRYRSEEIQEIFMRRSTALKYDVKRKKFTTMVEARHMVYKSMANQLGGCNMRMTLVTKAKRWAISLLDEVRAGHILTKPKAKAIGNMLRLVRTIRQNGYVRRYSESQRPLLPIPPTTGYSHHERIGEAQFLYTVFNQLMGTDVEVIYAFPDGKTNPNPVPKKLYEPRLFFLPTPRGIPMPKPSTPSAIQTVTGTLNVNMDGSSKAAWLERNASRVARQAFSDALENVDALVPKMGLTLLRKSKFPPPQAIKFASIGRKPTPGMMARGGLPMQLLTGELVSTYIPAQYGGLMVMDKATVSPGKHTETTISFVSLPMMPIPQEYLARGLEHPLTGRRHPTILISSKILPDNKYWFGQNRPEQTGETLNHGTRTSAWACALVVHNSITPLKFAPNEGVVSLNEPASNTSINTHVDLTYPFCEPSTRDNSSLDFYHLLLFGVFSNNHPQIFTACTLQEPGDFLRGSNMNGQLGHLVICVYRSWGFKQKETIQEFATDEGVPYWYNRDTGQTYWEKPFAEEEKKAPMSGGTRLADNKDHKEEPITVHRGQEGLERRYLQGEHRENMMHHLETKGEAITRRKKVASSTTVARDRLREKAERDGVENEFENPSIAGNPGTNMSQVSDEDGGGRIEDPLSMATDGSSAEQHEQQRKKAQEQVKARLQEEGSVHTHISDETSLVNNNGKHVSSRAPGDHSDPRGDAKHMQSTAQLAASMASDGQNQGQDQDQDQSSRSPTKQVGFVRGSALDGNSMHSVAEQPPHAFIQEQGREAMERPGGDLLKAGVSSVAGMASITAISKQMGQSLATMDLQNQSTEDLIQVGLGMGMAIMEQNRTAQEEARLKALAETSAGNVTRTTHGSLFSNESRLDGPNNGAEKHFFPSVTETDYNQDGSLMEHKKEQFPSQAHPIAEPKRTMDVFDKTSLVHDEEQHQADAFNELGQKSLTAMEHAQERRSVPQTVTDPPDVQKEKILSTELPANAEMAAKPLIPILLYPQLSTVNPNGHPKEIQTHGAAGDGTSFVTKEKADSMHFVPTAPGEPTLRRATVPLPIGFFEKIIAKNIATQTVDYLPQIPNLPQPRNVGRVKPRQVAEDWQAVGFDPWSAGKRPLNTQHISNLSSKAFEFLQDEKDSKAVMDIMRKEVMRDEYIEIEDTAGLNAAAAEVNTYALLADDFSKIASLVRHGKFEDVLFLIDQPDWSLPINYQNEAGNTLLHISCQNGSKRLIKLCIQRGADLDLANLNGQTALHFCYGYGYADVGDYLVSKGADDSILNKDKLTCYEGLGAQELEML